MVLNLFTAFHVVLSLLGIGSGFVLLYGWVTARSFERWTTFFLTTTVATTVTGFMFPFHKFLPSYAVGILSLFVLAIALAARYMFHLAGGWRRTYVVTATIALYLNFFVLIAQLFQKVPLLKTWAPTQSAPAFLIAQTAALILFVCAGVLAAIKFPAAPLQRT
jgi:hypothetical protein